MAHETVLLSETLQGINAAPGQRILNATLGGGGVERALLSKFGGRISILSLDADEDAVDRAKKEFRGYKNVRLVHENFRNLDQVLLREDPKRPDAIVFDLGLSSDQYEISGRGFSFERDEPLLMTLSRSPQAGELTAMQIVNEWGEEEIGNLLFHLADETRARRIARAIVAAREEKPIKTSRELASIVSKAIPRVGRIHPATKTFQALRIAVNGELTALQEALPKAFETLKDGGRLAVISFHSIEDRIVKNFMKEKAKEGTAKLLTKKPITPSLAEARKNPRSRSGKLRLLEKTND